MTVRKKKPLKKTVSGEKSSPRKDNRIKTSDRDSRLIRPFQEAALQKCGCMTKGDGTGLCYWLANQKPVFRCNLLDCMLFLLKACPTAAWKEQPDGRSVSETQE
jgi:hypothetical protein